MNNLTSNFSEDMSKYTVTVPALRTTAAGASITLPPVTFVFDTSSNVTVTNVVDALQQYVDEHKVPRYPYNEAYVCTWLKRNADLDGELAHAFEHALRRTSSLCRSLGYYLSSDQGMNLSRDALNSLRLTWTKHCIAELLMLKDKEMTKEMNEKYNYKLLRPVKFKDVQVGDVLVLKGSSPVNKSSVAYKADKFVVLQYSDGTESTCYRSRLESDCELAPLCWVEDKPVYPGDVLYRPAVEEGVALVASDVLRSESGVEYLHFSNAAGAYEYTDNRRGYLTWTKPEPKAIPSFQVEGQDVFPGDTVYYYGDNKDNWSDPYTVKENARIVQQATGCFGRVESLDNGAATFRLKPMLVIGDHLVPMPEREPLEEGETYFTPSLYNPEAVGCNTWRDTTHDRACLEAGLIHHTTKAAVAHGEAFRALSEKRD